MAVVDECSRQAFVYPWHSVGISREVSLLLMADLDLYVFWALSRASWSMLPFLQH